MLRADSCSLPFSSDTLSQHAPGALGMRVYGNTLEGGSLDLAGGTHDVDSACAALDFIAQQACRDVDGKYTLEPYVKRISGGQAAVAFATGRFGGKYAIKFFAEQSTFEQEIGVYKLLVSVGGWGGICSAQIRPLVPHLSVRANAHPARLLRRGRPVPARTTSCARHVAMRATDCPTAFPCPATSS